LYYQLREDDFCIRMRKENGSNVGKWCLEMFAHMLHDGAVVAKLNDENKNIDCNDSKSKDYN